MRTPSQPPSVRRDMAQCHVHTSEVLSRAEHRTSGLASQNQNFDWPSVQFDTVIIKFWLAIVENCMENGHGPAVIFSSA